MQARRASRELALILFSQLASNIETLNSTDFREILLNSIRTLIENSQDELQIIASELNDFKGYLIDYENDHEINLKSPIDAENKPVPVPLTNEMMSKVDTVIQAVDKSLSALDVVEFAILADRTEVRRYVELIFKTFKEQAKNIDDMIKEFAIGWDIDRLFKIDKYILRIAIAELIYIKDAPVKVVIDEALELAKKYSTNDSPSFINGILAKVVESNV